MRIPLTTSAVLSSILALATPARTTKPATTAPHDVLEVFDAWDALGAEGCSTLHLPATDLALAVGRERRSFAA
jgi:hypothetical protein